MKTYILHARSPHGHKKIICDVLHEFKTTYEVVLLEDSHVGPKGARKRVPKERVTVLEQSSIVDVQNKQMSLFD